MKRVFLFAVCALALPFCPARGADAGTEDQEITILQSDHSPAEKEAACARLKQIGTARCVPALAPLLADEQLSHSARYVLESMSGPDAEMALLRALDKTSGSNQIGIVNSLAVRKDPAAVPALDKFLASADTNLSCAAAMGLGHIGGPRALKALLGAWSDAGTGAEHQAEIDALLECANQLLTENKDSAALKVFQRLYDAGKDEGTRQAAYYGVLRASGKRGVSLMAEAIAGRDGAAQGAALQAALLMKGPAATKALADLLPKTDAPAQIALLECLRRRADSSALPAVARMIDSPDADVRMEAINALGDLGDGSVALPLAQHAVSAPGAEKLATRAALLNLRGNKVTAALLDGFASASPDVKTELIRALGDRGDASAAPRLLEWARSQDDSMRASSLQALALLSGPQQLPALVQLAVQATSDDARSEAAGALSSACQRIQSQTGHCEVPALVSAVQTGPVEARLALLPVCSGLAQAPMRDALRASLADPDARVRDAALRALCDTSDPEMLPDLVKAATGSADEKMRLLAVRGCVQLISQDEGGKLSADQKLDALKTILDKPLDTPEKRLVLSGLGAVGKSEALNLASAMLEDPAVKNEAAQSVIQIAGLLAGSDPKEAGLALDKVAATTTDPATKASAQEIQKKIWQNTGYITVWQMAGPYEQEGKNYSQLFDISFAPESADEASVKWKKMPVSKDASESWKMDFLSALGGNQRVAYARTWVNSPAKQNVRLELGSDDGIKVWLNDRLVHSHNIARACQPGEDKFDVTLNRGWNSLLVKVTQFQAGWGFCIRFCEPDGKPLAGLRASLSPATAAKRASRK
ncbi:MAG TPA: HEAT repeat domain-containing protein [Verrucomicrobiae bacterium]|jgi:HEAT repeat protein